MFEAPADLFLELLGIYDFGATWRRAYYVSHQSRVPNEGHAPSLVSGAPGNQSLPDYLVSLSPTSIPPLYVHRALLIL